MKRFLLAMTAMVALATSARADFITNGSSETSTGPAIPGTGIQTLPGGNTTLTGWTVTGGSVDYIDYNGDIYWEAAEGRRSIDLNGNNPGGILQTVTGLTIGAVYELTFALAGNPDAGGGIKNLDVSVTGGLTTGYSFDSTGQSHSDMGWVTETYFFTAVSTSAIVQFVSTTLGDKGAAIDDVHLELVRDPSVPVPASLALLLTGLPGFAGLGWVLRRKQKAAEQA
jgi:choice-of-anchor C domain-containing protein